MSINRILLSIIAIGLIPALFSGCVEPEKKAAPVSGAISHHVYDISYQVPAWGEWFFKHQDEYAVTLESSGKSEPARFVARIEVIDNDRYYTDDQLFFLMKNTFLLTEKTALKNRYEIEDSSVTKQTSSDLFCIRTYSKLKDFEPEIKPDNAGYIIIETIEHVCRHPRDSSKFVIIGFSMQSTPQNRDTRFLRRARDFFHTVEF